MLYLLSFFYGAAIGSFVEVVVTRFGVAPVYASRSKCLSCGEALRIIDLIPIFSYLFLRGRCRHCAVPYGKRTLLVEAMFGFFFVLLYHTILLHASYADAFTWLIYYTLLLISLGVIALYDLKHTYVPVTYLMLFLALSLVMLGIQYGHVPVSATLLGPVVIALPWLLIWLISKGKALGFGDVLLFAGVGAFFGIEQGFAVLLVSVWMGAVVGVCIYIWKQLQRKSVTTTAIPFVPFIVAAFLLVLFTDMSIFSIASYFS